MTYDLLHDPLIQTDCNWQNLPSLFAAMTRREVAGFPALRPHQRPAWHMFLVQLAVMALDKAGHLEPPTDETAWRAALRGLTDSFPKDEPWHLVVATRSIPAFLQPADPGGGKWSDVVTPDALDMLITSRNHDVKSEIAHHAAAQDWIFGLVSLQTMEGFGGRSNYGIARMNGGSSSRPMLALAPARAGSAVVDPSAWWKRDVLSLLGKRSGPLGKALLWIEPWPEGKSLVLDTLDPLFIEVCRRIRLVASSGTITAERSTSETARIDAKLAKGNTGDPWAPLHIIEGKNFSLGERDWTHEVLVDLLFNAKPEWRVPPLAKAHADETAEPMLLIAEAFSRGNSKTDGFRSRVVPIPKAMVSELFGSRPRSVTDGILKDISAVDHALRNGLATVAADGNSHKKLDKTHYARSLPARAALRRRADALFFPELWVRMELRSDADFAPVRLDFIKNLAGLARAEFNAALRSIPTGSLMRPRAEVRGRNALERGLFFAARGLEQKEEVDV